MTKYNYRFIMKKDSNNNWLSSNYIPLEGEPCFNTTTGELKIGNGVENFNNLEAISGGTVESSGITRIVDLNDVFVYDAKVGSILVWDGSRFIVGTNYDVFVPKNYGYGLQDVESDYVGIRSIDLGYASKTYGDLNINFGDNNHIFGGNNNITGIHNINIGYGNNVSGGSHVLGKTYIPKSYDPLTSTILLNSQDYGELMPAVGDKFILVLENYTSTLWNPDNLSPMQYLEMSYFETKTEYVYTSIAEFTEQDEIYFADVEWPEGYNLKCVISINEGSHTTYSNISGYNNKAYGNSSLIGGSNNSTDSSNALVTGEDNHVTPYAVDSVVSGRSNLSNIMRSHITGVANRTGAPFSYTLEKTDPFSINLTLDEYNELTNIIDVEIGDMVALTPIENPSKGEESVTFTFPKSIITNIIYTETSYIFELENLEATIPPNTKGTGIILKYTEVAGASVEGVMNVVGNAASHAEGKGTIAKGKSSHTEGYKTTTLGFASHAEGYGTIARADYSHASGTYNVGKTDAIMEVGIGNSALRKNGLEVNIDGTITAPSLNISQIVDPKCLVTKEYADTIINRSIEQIVTDGTTSTFTMSNTYIIGKETLVDIYLDRVIQIEGEDYNLSNGDTIDFTITPSDNSTILIKIISGME